MIPALTNSVNVNGSEKSRRIQDGKEKGEHRQAIERLKVSGYKKLRIDGEFYSLKEALAIDLDKYKKHNIEVAIDHLRRDGTKKTKERSNN